MNEIDTADFDLNLLTAFEQLERTRSVSKAARAMGITQSAMSHRLKRLREQLDDPLFLTGHGALVPTERAAAITTPIRRALVDLHRTLQLEDTFEPASSKRRFVIATSDYGEAVNLPIAVRRLAKAAPNVGVDIVPRPTNWPTQLETGELDLVTGPSAGSAPAGLKRRKLSAEGFRVMARKDHPGLPKHRLTLARYLSLQHVSVSPAGNPDGIVDRTLARQGLARHVAVRVCHFSSASFIVARTDLIGTVPKALASVAQQHLNVRSVPCPVALPEITSFMYWHPRAHHDNGHTYLRDMVAEVALEIVQG